MVTVRGHIVDGPPADKLQETLREAALNRQANTILDFSEMDYLDSTAIGVLVTHYVSVSKMGGKILIMGANDRVRAMMKIAHLDNRFGWSRDLDEARAWFKESSQ